MRQFFHLSLGNSRNDSKAVPSKKPQVAQARNMSNIHNIWEKNYHFCNLRKWKDFSLPNLKSVLRLSCVIQGPIYGRFMDFVNGFFPI